MNQEKRLFLAFTLSLLIILLWQAKFTPSPRKTILTNNVQSQQVASSTQKTQSLPLQKNEKRTVAESCQPVSFGRYELTICNPGGYIKNVYLKEYNEDSGYHDLLLLVGDEENYNIKQFNNKILLTGQETGRVKTLTLADDYWLRVTIVGAKNSNVLLGTVAQARGFSGRYQQAFYQPAAGKIKWVNLNRLKKSSLTWQAENSGFRSRYFLLAAQIPQTGIFVGGHWDNSACIFSIIKELRFKVGIYLGPEKLGYLTKHDLGQVVNYGIFHPVAVLLLKTLKVLHIVFRNWGLSIIVLSLLIYFAFSPLTKKSLKSMQMMQTIQPQMEELKRKYKDNPQKLNQEIMLLYKKYKVNPLSGCLPMLLQIPIFFALYQILMRFIAIKGAHFLWIKDLSLPDALFTFPASLPFIGKTFNLLPVLMAGVMFAQQKFTQPKTVSSDQQKMMTMFFPIFLGIIFYNFPAGLTLYWLTNSVLSAAYQYKINKSQLV